MFVCIWGSPRRIGLLCKGSGFYSRRELRFLDFFFLNNVCIDTLCLSYLFKNAISVNRRNK